MNTLSILGMIAGILLMYFGIELLTRKSTGKPNKLSSRDRYAKTQELDEEIKARRK